MLLVIIYYTFDLVEKLNEELSNLPHNSSTHSPVCSSESRVSDVTVSIVCHCQLILSPFTLGYQYTNISGATNAY